MMSFEAHKFLILMLIYLFFFHLNFGVILKNLLNPRSCRFTFVCLFHVLFIYLYFFNFYFYFILLYNTVLVLTYIDTNPPRMYRSSQTWTLLPPPTPHHPSGSSPCTSPKHPVSCIKHRLAIRFLHDSKHVSMPFSQIIPPSPSPTELLTQINWLETWPWKW